MQTAQDGPTPLPATNAPLVIRTNFENQQTWESICKLISATVHEHGYVFRASVEFLDRAAYRNLSKEDLLSLVTSQYRHSFFCVVDSEAVRHPEFAVLVVDVLDSLGKSFRAVPSQIQAIENNLSISNMDFEEFAANVAKDGIFRGFGSS